MQTFFQHRSDQSGGDVFQDIDFAVEEPLRAATVCQNGLVARIRIRSTGAPPADISLPQANWRVRSGDETAKTPALRRHVPGSRPFSGLCFSSCLGIWPIAYLVLAKIGSGGRWLSIHSEHERGSGRPHGISLGVSCWCGATASGPAVLVGRSCQRKLCRIKSTRHGDRFWAPPRSARGCVADQCLVRMAGRRCQPTTVVAQIPLVCVSRARRSALRSAIGRLILFRPTLSHPSSQGPG